MMRGALVVGLAGALVGLIVVLIAGSAYSPLLGATLAFVEGLVRSRQRHGRPTWFASTWLLAAGLLLPLAVTVFKATSRHHSVDLLPAMSLSLLILGAIGSAVVGLGRRGQPAVDGWTILNSLSSYATFGLCCLSLLVLSRQSLGAAGAAAGLGGAGLRHGQHRGCGGRRFPQRAKLRDPLDGDLSQWSPRG
jgi:hypothetical protein